MNPRQQSYKNGITLVFTLDCHTNILAVKMTIYNYVINSWVKIDIMILGVHHHLKHVRSIHNGAFLTIYSAASLECHATETGNDMPTHHNIQTHG